MASSEGNPLDKDKSHSEFLDQVGKPKPMNVDTETERSWHCLACSYRNENTLHLSCAVCGTARGHDSAMQTAAATDFALESFAPANNTTADTGTSHAAVNEAISQASMVATKTSVPDEDAHAALQVEEGKKTESEIIADDDNVMMQMPASANDEDRPEMIEDDDAAADDYFAQLQDREGGTLDKKPHAAPEQEQEPVPVTQQQHQPSQPHSTVLQSQPNLVLPPPQSMLPRPSEVAATQEPSSVPMFEVEARLVEEDPTPPQILDATLVETSPSNEDRWRRYRNQRYLIFGILLIFCVVLAIMGTLLASQGSSDKDNTIHESVPTNNPTPPADQGGPTNPPSDESILQPPTLRPSKSSYTKPTDAPSDKTTTSIPSISQSAQPTQTRTYETPTLRPSKSSSTIITDAPIDKASSTSPNRSPTTRSTDAPTNISPMLRPSKSPSVKPTKSSIEKPTTSTLTGSPSSKSTNTPSSEPASTKPIPIVTSQTKLLPNDGQADDRFGGSVSMRHDTVVIGASWADNDSGSDSGSAYVFVYGGDTWKQQAKLLPDDGQRGEFFGSAVSVNEDTIVIGAVYDDENSDMSGSAYVFIREGDMWTQQAKLLPDDGQYKAKFGTAVSVSGDTVIIGADQDNTFRGTAYIFIRDRDSWTQQAKLLPDDGDLFDQFGITVSVSGNTAVIGAYADDNDNGSGSGSAYVFIRVGDNWKQQVKLTPNDGAASDYFGRSVSVDRDTIVVGAYGDDDNGNNGGSAYVFTRNGDTWTQQAKLIPNDGAAGDEFGRTVSLSGDTAVIGASHDNDKGDLSGSAYVFIREGGIWKQQAKLLPNDGTPSGEFGSAVTVSGDTVVVGAPWNDNENGDASGSVYVYSLQT